MNSVLSLLVGLLALGEAFYCLAVPERLKRHKAWASVPDWTIMMVGGLLLLVAAVFLVGAWHKWPH